MESLKNKRVITIVVVCLIIGVGMYFVVSATNKRKSEEALNNGISYLTQGNYIEAIKKLEESKKLNSSDTKAEKILEVARGYKAIKEAYLKKDYKTTDKIFEEINTNEYMDLVKENLEVIEKDVAEKIKVIEEIDSIEGKVNELILGNNYDKCIEIISKYLKLDLNDEYTAKLNIQLEKVKAEKSKYDAEQSRLAEEKRKKEEEENKNKFNIFNPNRLLTLEEAKKLMYYRLGKLYMNNDVKYFDEGESKTYYSYYLIGDKPYDIWVDAVNGAVNLYNGLTEWEKYTKTESELKIGTDYGWVKIN